MFHIFALNKLETDNGTSLLFCTFNQLPVFTVSGVIMVMQHLDLSS